MPRGNSDYDLPVDYQAEYTNSDLNELAARLGIKALINRSGNIVGNIWPNLLTNSNIYVNTGAAGYLLPSTKRQMYGLTSLKCVAGASNGDEIGLIYNSAPFSGQRVGICALLEIQSFANTLFLEIDLMRDNVSYQGKVKLDISTGNMYTFNEVGMWNAIGTYKVPTGAGMGLVVKFSMNLDNQFYGKLWFGSSSRVDLSANKFYESSGAAPDQNVLRCYIKNNSALSNTIYITDVITTINELI